MVVGQVKICPWKQYLSFQKRAIFQSSNFTNSLLEQPTYMKYKKKYMKK